MKLPFVTENTIESVLAGCLRGDSLEFSGEVLAELVEHNWFLKDVVLAGAKKLTEDIKNNPAAHTPDVIGGKLLFQVLSVIKLLGVQAEVDELDNQWGPMVNG